MRNKIYIVTKGSYSDYHIICACPLKKTAKEAAGRYNRLTGMRGYADGYADKHRVEELAWVTDPASDIVLETLYEVEVNDDGEVVRQYEISYASPGSPMDDEYYDDSSHPVTRVNEYYDPSSQSFQRVNGTRIQGRSRRGYDVALKVARDKLAELKAQDAGI